MKKYWKYFRKGKKLSEDKHFLSAQLGSSKELLKKGDRTEVLNLLLGLFDRPASYLEIGVRNLEDNFLKIESSIKFSVDPGLESDVNLADFKCTSDEFFDQFSKGELKEVPEKFDLIFIDGLHTAEQADKDIYNALKLLSEDGFIVVHDCNPPSPYHAREEFSFQNSPAGVYWNGTTWKAFVKWRKNKDLYSCCVDTDWGVGVFSKRIPLGKPLALVNEFYEFKEFEKQKKDYLNLVSLEEFKKLIQR